MPEGPEIRRAADALAAAIGSMQATGVWFRFERLKPHQRRLAGKQVSRVEAKGKALLIHFSGGLTIYSHNQLYGRWKVVSPGDEPDTRRSLRLAIHTTGKSALLFSASDIAVLNENGLLEHPYLAKLGPDPLQPDLSAAFVAKRFGETRFRRRQLGGLLLDQAFVAGLGNYLRCEILFAAGLHPAVRAADCGPEEIQRLSRTLLRLPRQSYRLGGITNDPVRARNLMAEGYTFEDARFLVFRRSDKPCYRCGSTVARTFSNGRPFYLCHACQPSRMK